MLKKRFLILFEDNLKSAFLAWIYRLKSVKCTLNEDSDMEKATFV